MVPYNSNAELPDAVKNHLPEHAQDIFRKAYNNAHEEYLDPKKRRDPNASLEEVCSKVAWSAVKNDYVKKEDGWHKK